MSYLEMIVLTPEDKKSLIGNPIETCKEYAEKHMKYVSMREIHENTFMSMDARPGRLNFIVDNFNNVTDVYYG